MDKLALLNEVVKIVKPDGTNRPTISSMDDNLLSLNLDSLDTFLITIYLSDVYGVAEETLRELRPVSIDQGEGKLPKRMLTATQIFDFMEQNKTKQPASIEEAMSNIK